MPHTVRIQGESIDVAREIELLAVNCGVDTGAIVTFCGLCRDEAGRLSALELEHYPGMAEAEIERIIAAAEKSWPTRGSVVIHRHGRIQPGETIVLVAIASRHRQAAFSAASFIMDFLKSRAPFWKKEILADGTDAGWVDARAEDEAPELKWAELSSR